MRIRCVEWDERLCVGEGRGEEVLEEVDVSFHGGQQQGVPWVLQVTGEHCGDIQLRGNTRENVIAYCLPHAERDIAQWEDGHSSQQNGEVGSPKRCQSDPHLLGCVQEEKERVIGHETENERKREQTWRKPTTSTFASGDSRITWRFNVHKRMQNRKLITKNGEIREINRQLMIKGRGRICIAR